MWSEFIRDDSKVVWESPFLYAYDYDMELVIILKIFSIFKTMSIRYNILKVI